MDLKEGWEKKALIGVGVVVLIIIIYAYFVPFSGTPEPSLQTNQSTPAQVVPVPYVIPAANNSTYNNSTYNWKLYINSTIKLKILHITLIQTILLVHHHFRIILILMVQYILHGLYQLL